MLNRPKPLVLPIFDGSGHSLDVKYNAIAMADIRCWDGLQREYSMAVRACSGNVAGFPDRRMSHSKRGHQHLGSGRYGLQELFIVSVAIKESRFFAKPALCRIVDDIKADTKAPHFLGRLSQCDGLPDEMTGKSQASTV